MIKVDKPSENLFVCNSCMDKNAYRILAMPNENNGCAIYLCKECLEIAIGKIVMLDRDNFITEHIKKMRGK